MKITILEEHGFDSAMRGIRLSFDSDIKKMPARAIVLSDMDLGHNKFLESIQAWMMIDAPRFWWSEFDTYRVGMSKQSESTMHTLKKRHISLDDFEHPIPETYLSYLNDLVDDNADIEVIKNMLPEGFMQKRQVCCNYKTIRNILLQRQKHKLPQWRYFCDEMKNLKHYGYLGVK